MKLIELTNVTKGFSENIFRHKVILDNIDFTVKIGDFVVLQGANGTGKSTLLKLILGLQEPDSGSIQLFGKSPKSPESKLQVGTVFQEVNPPSSLKVKELVDLVRSYYPNSIATQEILKTCGLEDKKYAFPKELSGGQKQRLYFALALVGNPQLLVLDEPTKNLDVEGLEAFWHQIEACHAKGVAILMITHIQSDRDRLQSLATHIVTLTDGKLTYERQPSPETEELSQAALSPEKPVNFLKVLCCQTWIEFLQLFRNLQILIVVLLFSGLPTLFLQHTDTDSDILKPLAIIAAFNLILFSIDNLSKQVATERIEGWLKLLRVTPLSPNLYIAAKAMMTLLVLSISLATVFGMGSVKLNFHPALYEWLLLGTKLLIVTSPFAVLGIALGYAFPPKVVNCISALVIVMIALLSGFIPLANWDFIQDIIVVSPFFHYREIVEAIAGINDKPYWILNLLWLAFYGILSGLIAKFAYQRDSVFQ